MSEPPIAMPVDAPEAVVADDMPCVICGYNLRGLQLTGRCPECASPVTRSVHGNLLRYADANWLRRVLLGVRLQGWSLIIAILFSLCNFAATLLNVRLDHIFVPISLATCMFELLAAFLITVQEPAIASSESRLTWRRVVRWCAAIACLEQVFSFLEGTYAGWVLTLAGITLQFSGVLGYIGRFVYLRAFALRVPDPKLARTTRLAMVGYAGSLLGGIAFQIAIAILRPSLAGWVIVALSLSFLTWLLFAIWYVILLMRYGKVFRGAINDSLRLGIESSTPAT